MVGIERQGLNTWTCQVLSVIFYFYENPFSLAKKKHKASN